MGTGEVTWLLNEEGKNDIWQAKKNRLFGQFLWIKATGGSRKIMMGRIPL